LATVNVETDAASMAQARNIQLRAPAESTRAEREERESIKNATLAAKKTRGK
jgi:hypothetical protein